MIKRIFHTADWHLKPYKDHQRFEREINFFLQSVHTIVSREGLSPEEVRIVVVGDLFDNKSKEASNEAMLLMARMLKKIADAYPTIVTIGNHDYDKDNTSRLDCITPIYDTFKMFDYDRIDFYKKSKCVVDDNIVFCNYSVYEDNVRPPIEEYREKYPDKTFVGLFHDMLLGSLGFLYQDLSQHSSHAVNVDTFQGCDFVLLGDIHKHQLIPFTVPVVYAGSLYQIGFGESIDGHGFVVWDVEKHSYEFVEQRSEYAFCKASISDPSDILSGNLKILN